MTKSAGPRKVFVLDTSVLLYDKNSISSFPNNDVILTLTVLDELDRFKEKPGLLGESARHVIRFLDSQRQTGNLHDGIPLKNKQTLKIISEAPEQIPASLSSDSGDNKILGSVLYLKKVDLYQDRKIILVTKDINLRVKCDALGIEAQDYYKDKVINDRSEIYSGSSVVDLDSEFSDKTIDLSPFFSSNELDVSFIKDARKLCPNQLLVLKQGQSSAIGMVKDDKMMSLDDDLESKSLIPVIKPRNKEQKFAKHLLFNQDIHLVTLNGIAGSGKTYLTILACLAMVESDQYERIIFTRSIQPVGKDLGFLPGTIDEKMAPWMSPIMDNFRSAFGKDTKDYFEQLVKKQQIEIAPLSYMRGRTFDKSLIVVDEAQNATIHELKTLITRVGAQSKIILLGDTNQIDTPYLDQLSNGLTVIIEKFKNESIAGHITLTRGERSALATLASKII